MHWPYRLQTGELFDYDRKYESEEVSDGSKITRFKNDIRTIPLLLTVWAQDEAAYKTAINQFFEIADYDVISMKPGRLYVFGQYMECYIHKSTKTEWEYGIESLDNDIEIVSPRPVWVTEYAYSFIPGTSSGEQSAYLDYPHGYDYDYKMDGVSFYVDTGHYAPSDFKMIIYGPCINPSVTIGDYTYTVYTQVHTGEYLAIDSKAGTVIRTLSDGTQINEFNRRDKSHSIFRKIPAGPANVLWSGNFGLDITLYAERSEPKWT